MAVSVLGRQVADEKMCLPMILAIGPSDTGGYHAEITGVLCHIEVREQAVPGSLPVLKTLFVGIRYAVGLCCPERQGAQEEKDIKK